MPGTVAADRRCGHPRPDPTCRRPGTLTEPRAFNLMFETHIGAVARRGEHRLPPPRDGPGHLRQLQERLSTPAGSSSRSGSPRSARASATRSRRATSPSARASSSRWRSSSSATPTRRREWYKYWRDARFQWYIDLGLRSEKLRLRDHDPDELAFYSTATADIEYEFPFGVSELEGIAHRGDYDLTQHQKFSGKDLATSTRRRRSVTCRTSSSRRPGPTGRPWRSSARRTPRTRSAARRGPS